MQLVSFLVSGVKGAENGSATFVLRGTASSAASVLFNDFEGTSQPGANIITLDANGAAEIYCNAYCDVTLKTSAGVTLRTVTVGNAAACVEVISDSFTGTGYTGSPTAASQPITLAAILDKWNNSSGALDWKVLVNGSSVNLSSAFSSFAGLFFNVKDPTYGAVGDGITNDNTAITNAISAANTSGGGIVFFPPGTYKVSSLASSASKIHLLGSGQGNTIITGSSSAPVISFTDATIDTWKVIEGITLKISSLSTNIVSVFQGSNTVVKDCFLDGTNITGTALILINSGSGSGRCSIINCRLKTPTLNFAGVRNVCADGQNPVQVFGCLFNITSGYTGTVISGPDFNVHNCDFDGSGNASSFTMVSPNSNSVSNKKLGVFTGNVFRTAATTGVVFDLSSSVTGSKFHESGNTFFGFDVANVTTSSTRLYNFSAGSVGDLQISCQSRKSRSFKQSGTTTGTLNLAIEQDYGSITFNATDNVSTTVNTTTFKAPGMDTNIVVINNSGSTKTVSFNGQVTWTNLVNNGIASTTVLASQSNSSTIDDALKGHGAD